MALKPKYTEVNRLDFELDDYFVNQVKKFEPLVAVRIAKEIDTVTDLKNTNGRIENLSSYVKNNNGKVVFFMIDYFVEENGPIVLIDIYPISSDEYLDQINLNKHIIKFNEMQYT